MSQAPNIIAFSVILGIVTLAIDIYVTTKFSKFAQRSLKSVWWTRIAWTLFVLMNVLYWFVVYRRHFFRMDGFDVGLFTVVCFWILPKYAIAIFLLVKDVYAFLIWMLKKIRVVEKQNLNTNINKVVSPEHTQENSRRDFLGKVGWTAATVPYVIIGNGIFRTVYDFQMVEVEVKLLNLPKAFDGFQLAQISDIHAGSFPDHKPFQQVRHMLAVRKPDAIVITGDYVNAKPTELSVIAKELVQLSAPYGVFGSLGNHDHYNTPQEHKLLVHALRQMNINMLVNQNHRFRAGTESFVLAGIDNTGFNQKFGNLSQALHHVTAEDATILLAHDPTFWDKEVVKQAPVGLTLSGHTHGGQFGVQILGFEWSPAKHVYKQWAGMYTKGDQQIYVNRGIGTVGPPLRIGVPPEITVFTLRAAGASEHLV